LKLPFFGNLGAPKVHRKYQDLLARQNLKKKYGGDAVLKKKKTKKTCFIGHFFLK
jgi:hypothetical protein